MSRTIQSVQCLGDVSTASKFNFMTYCMFVSKCSCLNSFFNDGQYTTKLIIPINNLVCFSIEV